MLNFLARFLYTPLVLKNYLSPSLNDLINIYRTNIRSEKRRYTTPHENKFHHNMTKIKSPKES